MIAVTIARKPLRGTVSGNVILFRTGGLNIDPCRIKLPDGVELRAPQSDPANRKGQVGADWQTSSAARMHAAQAESIERTNTLGRWPANVILNHQRCQGECQPDCPIPYLDAMGEAAGVHGAGHATPGGPRSGVRGVVVPLPGGPCFRHGDTGGAARFFKQVGAL